MLSRILSQMRPAGSSWRRAGPTADPGRRSYLQLSRVPTLRRLATGPVAVKPRMEGFFAPAEFSPHTRCLVGWAWNEEVWPWKAARAKKVVLEVVRRIIENGEEDVALVCDPDQPSFSPRELMDVQDLMGGWEGAGHRLEVWPMKVDWCYLRDTTPTFVVSQSAQEVRGVSWSFTEYGYALPLNLWAHDATLAERICQERGYQCYKSELRVEGGALAFNGAGVAITTESVLLDKRRNPGRLKGDVEQELKEYLGCERVVWLEKGLPYDNTKGHVDNLAAFVSESEVVLSWIDEDRDPELHRSLSKSKATLEAHGLTVHKLHLPDQLFRMPDEYPIEPSYREAHLRGNSQGNLPGSYVNFYIANKAVVMPMFDQPHWDRAAQVTLQKLFAPSGRAVVGVSSRDLLIGGGNIHCLTQQVPSLPQ